MKALMIPIAAAAVSFATLAGAQEAKQDFTLINKTGYELKEVYVSPNHAADWQEDVLGQDTLADDARVNIHFNRASKTCHWDLKVVYSDDDSSAVWSDINLCQVERITIRYNRQKDQTSASFD